MNIQKIIMVVTIAGLIYSCSQPCKEKPVNELLTWNDLIPKEIIIYHLLDITDTIHPERYKGFNGTAWAEKVINLSLSGKVKLYYPEFTAKPIPLNELRCSYGEISDTFQIQDPKTDQFITKVVTTPMNISEMNKIFFEESWYFNKTQFSMRKKIKQWYLVREFKRKGNDEKLLMKVFSIIQDSIKKTNTRNSSILIAKNIHYEFSLEDNTERGWIKELNTGMFIEFIMDKVLSGSIPAYDPNNPEKKLTKKDIRIQFDALWDTVEVENTNTDKSDTMLVEKEIRNDEIKSVIFIEDFYFDEKTFSFEKKVIGITLVRWYFKEKDVHMKDMQKKSVFTVYFHI